MQTKNAGRELKERGAKNCLELSEAEIKSFDFVRFTQIARGKGAIISTSGSTLYVVKLPGQQQQALPGGELFSAVRRLQEK